jgi:hypothetical protein
VSLSLIEGSGSPPVSVSDESRVSSKSANVASPPIYSRETMKSSNYLQTQNTQKAKLDGGQAIYRMMPLCYLLEFFESKQNVLVKPHKWKDPFENHIIETENVYGQCWTFAKASDALWKIYSKDSVAIRVKSRVQTLKKTLEKVIVDLV